ncbi:MAG: TIGR03915 family putative DNA repair protein [Proteobacteria bacterium]|nr:TIGR03915 family putative DNA repair protein [Pseudomonadota bacterium]
MASYLLEGPDDRAGFWRAACGALAAGADPNGVRFVLPTDAPDLFASAPRSASALKESDTLDGKPSGEMAALLDDMLLHAAPERFSLAYRLLWRTRRELALARIGSDPDVSRALDMAKSVRRDKHKMTAFVRFRAQTSNDGAEPHYVAWFEPEHHIVSAVAPFFVGRFTGMRWSILTPRRSAHWDGETLQFAGGAAKSDAPDEDPLEDVWRAYYVRQRST